MFDLNRHRIGLIERQLPNALVPDFAVGLAFVFKVLRQAMISRVHVALVSLVLVGVEAFAKPAAHCPRTLLFDVAGGTARGLKGRLPVRLANLKARGWIASYQCPCPIDTHGNAEVEFEAFTQLPPLSIRRISRLSFTSGSVRL